MDSSSSLDGEYKDKELDELMQKDFCDSSIQRCRDDDDHECPEGNGQEVEHIPNFKGLVKGGEF